LVKIDFTTGLKRLEKWQNKSRNIQHQQVMTKGLKKYMPTLSAEQE